jgi:hypothetical protein
MDLRQLTLYCSEQMYMGVQEGYCLPFFRELRVGGDSLESQCLTIG